MKTVTFRFALVVGALALSFAAPATAAPARDFSDIDRGAADPRRALDSDLPTDRPIVATVVEIDGAAGTVMLSTPHGPVQLAVSPELAEKLSVGDVVVVRITDEDDYPSASPREEPSDPQAPTDTKSPRSRTTL